MSRIYTLVTGRSAEQGRALHKGKLSEAYHHATTLVEMNPEDTKTLGVTEGQLVRVSTSIGEVTLSLQIDKHLPPGMLFIPMGPSANRLIGPDTDSTGMPHYKGLLAEVEPA